MVFSGCGVSNKAVTERVPMIVIDGGAALFDGNELIATLPAGTEVSMIEQKDKWCVVEVCVDDYNMKVKGSISSSALVPAPENISVSIIAPAVSPVYEPRRKEIWTSFFTDRGVNDIALRGDDVWLGTTTGLVKFPAQAPSRAVTYTTADGLVDDDVLSVDAEEDGVWAGTMKGASRLNGDSFVNYTTEDGLMKGAIVAVDAGEDYVWLGLDSGIARFDKGLGFIKNFPHSGGWAPESGSGSVSQSDKSGIYADTMLIEGDTIWNAAFNLTKTSVSGRDIKTYSCGEGLIHSRVVDLHVDHDNIWAINLGGITRIDRHDDTLHENFHVKGGYGKNPMIAGCPDGDYLWVAMKDGISKFDMKKKKFVTYFACWDLFDGGYISNMKADDNYLWLATTEGLWRMDKKAADAISDHNLLDDFESKSRTAYRGWPLGRRGGSNGSEKVFVDYTVGANDTSASLCNMYVAPDYDAHSIGHLRISLRDMDLTDYDGISFFVKADPGVKLSATMSESNETWDVGYWHVPSNWMEVRVPFSRLKLHGENTSNPSNRIVELYAMNNLSFKISRDSAFGRRPRPNEGEIGKIWVDEIRFFKATGREALASK
jgi:ligand-binding sensor domain-containing protein